jgi:hypothetical protein
MQLFSCILFYLHYFVGMKARTASLRAAPPAADGAALPAPFPWAQSRRASTGKIARLPHSVREELNERLRDGRPCAEILPWLNALPVVREILRTRFDASPITKDNISRWRHGGYAGWLEHEQNKEAIAIMAAACRGIDQGERDELTSQIALVVTARMVMELRKFDQMPEGPEKSAAWRDLVWSLVLLRRGEFYHEKMRLERDKLPVRKDTGPTPQSKEQRQEIVRQAIGFGGAHWNNFTQQWEGEGAAEMTEFEEVERLGREELRRRKAALAAAPPPNPADSPAP